MKLFGLLLAIAISIVLLIVVIYLGSQAYEIGSAVVSGAKELKPEIYVPLVVTLSTAVLGLGVTLFTQSRIRRREIESAHRERKLEIYLEFLKHIEVAMLSVNPRLQGEAVDQNELAVKLVEFRTKAVLWGSPGVLKAVAEMARGEDGSPTRMFDILDTMQREMRKDIGLSNWGLEKDFFAKLPLSDPDELDAMRRT